MKKAILGKKIGMTQIFSDTGIVIPVTVVEAGPCVVLQKLSTEREGYDALRVGFDPIREKLANNPHKGQFGKADAVVCRNIRELKLEDCSSYNVGDSITADIFADGDLVDAIGITRGHGFSGTIKRWNQHRGPMTHGSKYHRGLGALSANSSPSRVFKNKRMPGQYGAVKATVQNLKIVRVDAQRNLILIKGSIPGAKGSLVFIRDAVKQ
ncbi:MAG: 50S ribosomal protein L3 [Christensenellales bacterium]